MTTSSDVKTKARLTPGIARLHNRLIDLAIIGDLRGAPQSAACFRYAADELARIINAALAR